MMNVVERAVASNGNAHRLRAAMATSNQTLHRCYGPLPLQVATLPSPADRPVAPTSSETQHGTSTLIKTLRTLRISLASCSHQAVHLATSAPVPCDQSH